MAKYINKVVFEKSSIQNIAFGRLHLYKKPQVLILPEAFSLKIVAKQIRISEIKLMRKSVFRVH